jgi:XapX domain-containing protein
MKEFMACLLALCIGVGCARYSVPLPAPESWLAVALIALMLAGYEIGRRM